MSTARADMLQGKCYGAPCTNELLAQLYAQSAETSALALVFPAHVIAVTEGNLSRPQT